MKKTIISKISKTKRLCEKIEQKGHAANLYYEIEGRGCPLLLINGGPGATHHYFHPSFSRAKDFCRIIYYDQAGCGLSRKEKNYSLSGSLEDIEALRKKLKIERWFVFGHSYGGLLAQIYALKCPNRVSGLILCCTAPGFEVGLTTTEERNIVFTKSELEKIGEIQDSNMSEEEKYFNMLRNGYWKKHYFKKPSRKRMAEMSLYDYEVDPGLVSQVDKETATVDLQGRFDNFKIHTLIIEAGKDLTWHVVKREKLKRNHLNAQFILITKSCHYPFEDKATRFFKVLENFIKTTD